MSDYYNLYDESSASESETEDNIEYDNKIETYEQNINKICKTKQNSDLKLKVEELDKDINDYTKL